MKHVLHVSDAGRVETQRLVECLRVLFRVEGESSERGRGRRAGRWAGVGRLQRKPRAKRRVRQESAREERTSNISSMFVTPEVLQLDMSALKSSEPEKSPLMSVMPETSQVSMGPYVAVAEFTLSLYS